MMSSDSNWASVMYGSDTSPAPAPAAKPAATPASLEGSWAAVMRTVEEPTGEPGPWSGSDQEPPAADDAAPVVPESYSFDLPKDFELDAAMDKEMQAAFKEIKLPKDQAQKLVDLHAKAVQQQQAAFDRTLESWSSETMSALGATAPEVFAHARAGLEMFDKGGQIRELLDRSGLGNRLEFIRLFEQLGRDLEYQKAYQREAARRRP